MIFPASLRPDGQPSLDDRPAMVSYLKELAGKGVSRLVFDIQAMPSRHSAGQRRRFWLMCQMVADIWSVGRAVPIHKDEAKAALCRAFLGVVETPMSPEAKGIRYLSIEDMSRVMQEVEAHFAAEGTPLPLDGF